MADDAREKALAEYITPFDLLEDAAVFASGYFRVGWDAALRDVAQEPAGWRPIETAPRDGRELLFAVPIRDPEGVTRSFVRELARWDDGGRHCREVEAGWRDNAGDVCDFITDREGVMWMEVPLPTPPKEPT